MENSLEPISGPVMTPGNYRKEVKNPQYLWVSRFAFWLCVLVVLPLFSISAFKNEVTIGNAMAVLLYCYVALANYIMGYRLEDPPKWASWVVREKWIAEWKYLVLANPEDIKSNQKGLIRVVGGATLLAILLLAFLNGKL